MKKSIKKTTPAVETTTTPKAFAPKVVSRVAYRDLTGDVRRYMAAKSGTTSLDAVVEAVGVIQSEYGYAGDVTVMMGYAPSGNLQRSVGYDLTVKNGKVVGCTVYVNPLHLVAADIVHDAAIVLARFVMRYGTVSERTACAAALPKLGDGESHKWLADLVKGFDGKHLEATNSAVDGRTPEPTVPCTCAKCGKVHNIGVKLMARLELKGNSSDRLYKVCGGRCNAFLTKRD